jgi:hypothetical protein
MEQAIQGQKLPLSLPSWRQRIAALLGRSTMTSVRLALGIACAVLLLDNSAQAQDTIGQVLAAGGKKLTKDEALALLRGATIAGPTAVGGEIHTDLQENGTTAGYLTNAGRRGAIFGTWSIDEAGRLCRDIEIRFYESSRFKDCLPVYRLGDEIYLPAGASADPSVRVLKRTVTRQAQ